ncbi:hypothetical protein GIB67_028330, partial [Kingdonia uniflora]
APTIAATAYLRMAGRPPVLPSSNLSFSENFSYISLQTSERWLSLKPLRRLKGELMVLGFISLLLTFGQVYIVRICIPIKAADSMLPCPLRHAKVEDTEEHRRRLLWNDRRFLAAVGASVKKCKTVSVFCT